jgi:hypothetical protein
MEIPKPPVRLYYEYEGTGWEPLNSPTQYFTADEGQILAQPCVVEALRKEYLRGSADNTAATESIVRTSEALTACTLHAAAKRVEAAEQALADARAAWEREQSEDEALIRTVAAHLRRAGAEVPSPLAEAEESAMLTHPVVVSALGRARESS